MFSERPSLIVIPQFPKKEEKVSPLCATFPKTISCDVPSVGVSGGMQWHNGLCVLSQAMFF